MSNDVIWPAILDFAFFLKSLEITKINPESSQDLNKQKNSVTAYQEYKTIVLQG